MQDVGAEQAYTTLATIMATDHLRKRLFDGFVGNNDPTGAQRSELATRSFATFVDGYYAIGLAARCADTFMTEQCARLTEAWLAYVAHLARDDVNIDLLFWGSVARAEPQTMAWWTPKTGLTALYQWLGSIPMNQQGRVGERQCREVLGSLFNSPSAKEGFEQASEQAQVNFAWVIHGLADWALEHNQFTVRDMMAFLAMELLVLCEPKAEAARKLRRMLKTYDKRRSPQTVYSTEQRAFYAKIVAKLVDMEGGKTCAQVLNTISLLRGDRNWYASLVAMDYNKHDFVLLKALRLTGTNATADALQGTGTRGESFWVSCLHRVMPHLEHIQANLVVHLLDMASRGEGIYRFDNEFRSNVRKGVLGLVAAGNLPEDLWGSEPVQLILGKAPLKSLAKEIAAHTNPKTIKQVLPLFKIGFWRTLAPVVAQSTLMGARRVTQYKAMVDNHNAWTAVADVLSPNGKTTAAKIGSWAARRFKQLMDQSDEATVEPAESRAKRAKRTKPDGLPALL